MLRSSAQSAARLRACLRLAVATKSTVRIQIPATQEGDAELDPLMRHASSALARCVPVWLVRIHCSVDRLGVITTHAHFLKADIRHAAPSSRARYPRVLRER